MGFSFRFRDKRDVPPECEDQYYRKEVFGHDRYWVEFFQCLEYHNTKR